MKREKKPHGYYRKLKEMRKKLLAPKRSKLGKILAIGYGRNFREYSFSDLVLTVNTPEMAKLFEKGKNI